MTLELRTTDPAGVRQALLDEAARTGVLVYVSQSEDRVTVDLHDAVAGEALVAAVVGGLELTIEDDEREHTVSAAAFAERVRAGRVRRDRWTAKPAADHTRTLQPFIVSTLDTRAAAAVRTLAEPIDDGLVLWLYAVVQPRRFPLRLRRLDPALDARQLEDVRAVLRDVEQVSTALGADFEVELAGRRWGWVEDGACSDVLTQLLDGWRYRGP